MDDDLKAGEMHVSPSATLLNFLGKGPLYGIIGVGSGAPPHAGVRIVLARTPLAIDFERGDSRVEIRLTHDSARELMTVLRLHCRVAKLLGSPDEPTTTHDAELAVMELNGGPWDLFVRVAGRFAEPPEVSDELTIELPLEAASDVAARLEETIAADWAAKDLALLSGVPK